MWDIFGNSKKLLRPFWSHSFSSDPSWPLRLFVVKPWMPWQKNIGKWLVLLRFFSQICMNVSLICVYMYISLVQDFLSTFIHVTPNCDPPEIRAHSDLSVKIPSFLDAWSNFWHDVFWGRNARNAVVFFGWLEEYIYIYLEDHPT